MVYDKLQPVRAECNGIPVYGFGYTYVYGVSPDFIMGVKLQEGNDSPVRKIKPKKSWEIEENKLGTTPARLPRTALNDFQPQLSIRLIDGDRDTFWCDRGQNQPDVEPSWIRIDLAKERLIKSVVIVPREDNKGMPADLNIKVSRDAWHWETVYENHVYVVPEDTKPRIFSFEPRRVKQIWIIGRNLPVVFHGSFSFSVAEVEVIDEDDENVALVSRGAGVTVSSTNYGLGMARETQEMLWDTHYDLGLKWIRVGYSSMSTLSWSYVERDKGKYAIDPRTDEIITESVKNGLNIVLSLCATNWLYTPQGHRDPKHAKQLWEMQENQFGNLPGAIGTLPTVTVPGMLEGYMNFVRFMVRHFKDRIRYFEIWNEEEAYFPSPQMYCYWVKNVVPIIREEAPEAKIVLGGVSGFRKENREFLVACLQEGVGKLVDIIAWHPFYSADPESERFKSYVADVKEFKKFAESYGFKGEYHANEWDWFAPYPAPKNPQDGSVSELAKAKYAARLTLTHVGLDIVSFWNETLQDQHIDRDVGLFRNTFSADPFNPTQPQPVYYVYRTLCTLLEKAIPAEIEFEFSRKEKIFETVGLESKDGDLLLAVWITGRGNDDFRDEKTDIIFPNIRFQKATGIDVLNGTEQTLQVTKAGGNSVLKEMLIKDYPILIKASKKYI